jgi:hypothetical protein
LSVCAYTENGVDYALEVMINGEKEGKDNDRVSITTSLLVVNGSWKLVTKLQQNKLLFTGTTSVHKTLLSNVFGAIYYFFVKQY